MSYHKISHKFLPLLCWFTVHDHEVLQLSQGLELRQIYCKGVSMTRISRTGQITVTYISLLIAF